jgi:hypothetical protein
MKDDCDILIKTKCPNGHNVESMPLAVYTRAQLVELLEPELS